MKSALVMASWMLFGASAHAADDIEPLDADFLEYLANIEDDGDDWTLLDEAGRNDSSHDPDSERAAEKAGNRNAKQEAAKPAVEKR